MLNDRATKCRHRAAAAAAAAAAFKIQNDG